MKPQVSKLAKPRRTTTRTKQNSISRNNSSSGMQTAAYLTTNPVKMNGWIKKM
jgi:hypothetical protein